MVDVARSKLKVLPDLYVNLYTSHILCFVKTGLVASKDLQTHDLVQSAPNPGLSCSGPCASSEARISAPERKICAAPG